MEKYFNMKYFRKIECEFTKKNTVALLHFVLIWLQETSKMHLHFLTI